jgi:hypothetical protein
MDMVCVPFKPNQTKPNQTKTTHFANHPNQQNCFLSSTTKKGVKVNKLRIDGAGYQTGIIDFCFDKNISITWRGLTAVLQQGGDQTSTSVNSQV